MFFSDNPLPRTVPANLVIQFGKMTVTAKFRTTDQSQILMQHKCLWLRQQYWISGESF